MRNPIKLFVMFLLVNIFGFNVFSQSKSKIQVALILDTSNSMDGLIDQAKTQLWNVVNEFATAKYSGESPELQIALYEYGNDGLQAEEGYLREVSELTTDLDKISEDLFGLKTNGGSEYCGWVIGKATERLGWSKSNSDLKLIFIAGNEEFTQGKIDYKTSCSTAISKGIIINTIFCGNMQEGIRTKWKHGADLADGNYLNINQNETVGYIESPFDDEIIKLSTEINKTYVAYGSRGNLRLGRQRAQDNNAMRMNKAAATSRAKSKSMRVYKNSSWDIVDAVDEEGVEIKEISDSDLPDEMKKMTTKEKEKYIYDKKRERIEIQNKISELNDKRDNYVKKIRKEKAEKSTLGDAILETVREQAKKKNYTFEK